jgi:hypothetical protein
MAGKLRVLTPGGFALASQTIYETLSGDDPETQHCRSGAESTNTLTHAGD